MPTPRSPQRILLIGSTGPMGRAVLTQSDPAQHDIRAFARRPAALESTWPNVVQGDVRDRSSLRTALADIDVVICTLGGKPWHRDARGVHEAGTANLISAMNEAGCGRLIAVTGVGAGSSRGHGPFYYNWFARPT
ncbi:MAG: NAD(P)H-binding protein, partial [Leucobacter sp.]|nr:NAD(P)H-binding protein [Leucobacter sp.]